MGIYISAMSLPKDGVKHLCVYPDGTIFDTMEFQGPLAKAIEIPHHGRLIEADKLMANIRAHDYLLTAMCNSQENGMFTCGIQQAVDEADTIIPADPEGEPT